jgi:cysteine dioxygenase
MVVLQEAFRVVSVQDTIAGLVEIEAGGLPSEAVNDYLVRTRIDSASLLPYLHFDPSHYTRNLIYRTAGFELLAICWDIGQAAPIHDHEEQRCWARVEQGMLQFTNYRLAADEREWLEQVGATVTGGPGHLDALAGIHSVVNDASSGERAVSLHLYAKPFPECTIYDLTRRETRRRRLQYDTVPELFRSLA